MSGLASTVGALHDTLSALGAPDGSIRARVRAVLSRASPLSRAISHPATASPLSGASPHSGTASPLAIRRPHYDGRRFVNAEPASPVRAGAVAATIRAMFGRDGAGRPPGAVPVEEPGFPREAGDLAVTWLGHASALLEVDGYRVLADPMFSRRASPAPFAGPSRLHAIPLGIDGLPPLDAVVISHDHYDHLDRDTMSDLVRATDAVFLVPLGIGAHLRAWGIPAARFRELMWGDHHEVGSLRLTCTPARHFSGRGLRRDATLWSSWAITGPSHRVFFGGDSGFTPQWAAIGREFGPFDLTLLPIGAYADAWPDVHMTPEQAVAAHRDLRGQVLLPIHWATFDLAPHPWAEPAERLIRAADGVTLALPPPGRRSELPPAAPTTPWWV